MRHLASKRWPGIFLLLWCSFCHGRYTRLRTHHLVLAESSLRSSTLLSPLLKVYVEYAVIASALSQQTQQTFERFVATHDDEYLNNKLRLLWLKELTRRHQYRDVLTVSRDIPVQPLSVVECYIWEARASLHEVSVWQQVKRSYFLDAPLDCLSTIDGLTQSDWVTDEDRWHRARVFWDQKNWIVFIDHIKTMKNADFDLHWLKQMIHSPRVFVVRYCAQIGRRRALTEAVLMAWSAYASKSIRGALALWATLDTHRLSSSQLNYINACFAYEAARAHLPQALERYRLVPAAELSDKQREWQIRAALYAGHWQEVVKLIQALPPNLLHKSVWIYWLARSQEELGHPQLAQSLYAMLTAQFDYYGLLSREKLGQRLTQLDVSLPAEEVTRRVANNIGIRRAIALAKLGLWRDEMAEWRWATRAFSDQELLAAASIAYQNRLYDCMIRAALATHVVKNFVLAYPILYRQAVEQAARRWQLNPAWIYGTIRQESRFSASALSLVGAQGLMQLMPHTVHRLAKFLRVSHRCIRFPEKNILLGTTYLWQLHDKFHAQVLLASAAYNAGPVRVIEWTPPHKVAGDVYIENIPFYETRLYVQKVLVNTFFYDMLLRRSCLSLHEWLGTVKLDLGPGLLQDVQALE